MHLATEVSIIMINDNFTWKGMCIAKDNQYLHFSFATLKIAEDMIKKIARKLALT